MSETKIIVLDDDPTGSQTVHSCLLLTRWDVATLKQGLQDSAPLFFVLTNTRGMSADQAASVTRDVCVNLRQALEEHLILVGGLSKEIGEHKKYLKKYISSMTNSIGYVVGLAVIQAKSSGQMYGQPLPIHCQINVGNTDNVVAPGKIGDIAKAAAQNVRASIKKVLENIGAPYVGHEMYVEYIQAHGGVEGDSASSAEAYALLSALSATPIAQGLAVTGSVNQHGWVQPIGGANQKIEGFYDICKVQGITGTQGVIIPLSNVDNLMLRQDVVDAVAEDRFNVYTMDTVDDAMAVLFAEPRGRPVDPAEINQAVSDRIAELHGFWMAANRGHGDERQE